MQMHADRESIKNPSKFYEFEERNKNQRVSAFFGGSLSSVKLVIVLCSGAMQC